VPTAVEARSAIESGLLIFLILGPCQELAARRPVDVELADIIEQLRAAMTQSVEHSLVSTTELAVLIGTHAAVVSRPLERKSTILKLLAALYLTRNLVSADRFSLEAGSTLDLATLRLIALLERDYEASWDVHEKAARRQARALHTALLRRGLYGGSI
jgi:hypothetical protein